MIDMWPNNGKKEEIEVTETQGHPIDLLGAKDQKARR